MQPKWMLLALVLCCNALSAQTPALSPVRLSCEYRQNPLGIDAPAPRLSWTLGGAGRDLLQTAYEVNVSTTRNGNGDAWKSGKVVSGENIHIAYAGAPLQSFTRYWWRVRVYGKDGKASAWSEPAWFETGALAPGDWTGQWINDGSVPVTKEEDHYADDPMPLLRKPFSTNGTIAAARLYITGAGYYEAYINGKKVGDQVLDPGWTSYGKRVLYAVHDITSLLKPGNNAAGIMLGNGWYNPLPLRMWGSRNWRDFLVTGRPCANAMIRITYTNGKTEVIATDNSWQAAPGPVIRNSVYLGEHYDARREIRNWSASQPAGNWQAAVVVKGPEGKMETQQQPPIRVTHTLRPRSVKEVKPGTYLVDMGQNFAGTVRIRVQGKAGSQVVLRYGEDTLKDGQINVMTAVAGQIKGGNGGPGAPRIAWQEDRYTLKGNGRESWSPRFTFHGFRYVEITGWPGKPGIADIDGLRLSADLPSAGSFTSSNTMLNRLDEVIRWTFLSNVFSVQSDCPAREKLAYAGDILCSAGAFMHRFQMPNFYTKTLRDHEDAQRPQGGITETAPFVGIADSGPGDGSGPMGWQAGYPFLIKRMYEFYGDKRIVEESYASMQKLTDFLHAKAKNNLFETEDLGDHEALDDREIPLSASLFYYLTVRTMAEFAVITDKPADAAKYAAIRDDIRQAVKNKFYQPANGQFRKGTQTAQAMGLWMDILEKGEEEKALQALQAAIDKKNGHIATGIFGTKMMFDVLREHNLNEVAYRVADQRSYPGWGHMIGNGATTLWETWAYSDNTFSQNHPMFGSIGEWFYRSLLGINAGEPGYRKIIIRPQPAGDLTFAKGHIQSMYGTIGSDWRISNGVFTLKTSIPANTTAEVMIPLKLGTVVKESGKPLQPQRTENGYAVFATGSGNYVFTVSK
ncbi:family 78 glycoside hydrolase catalytic domain [Chitinophaga sp.]|uniref:family 78 glycoside hydrolase catalytic domain n=1 Tax=Chitinophaga sp. TaxID=1869181 RepID=UPI002FDD2B98